MLVLLLLLIIGFVVVMGLTIALFYIHSEQEMVNLAEQYPEAIEYVVARSNTPKKL